jgi:uncharacterized membrane protein YhiD involved in acid resistance
MLHLMRRGSRIPWASVAACTVLLSLMGTTTRALHAQPSDGPDQLLRNQPAVSAIVSLKAAAIALPVATLLGAALAFRPRRRGTPTRSAAVVQTQIILAIIGAMVMLVVGASLARAFGVAGVAGLIRYRAKIDDPKDASVMLATLGVGLASGVGLYLLAAFSTLFVIGVLWVIESIEPHPTKTFVLKVKTKSPAKLQPRIEQLLSRSGSKFELRTENQEELCFQVAWPAEKRTDALSNAILKMEEAIGVEWDEKKKDKSPA